MTELTRKDIIQWNKDRQVRSLRTRDIRKSNKPYSCRDVVFTCSNGWTIERVPDEDHPIEGFFMGHCLGSSLDYYQGYTFYSLREPDGTPHVTIYYSQCFGRSNMAPRLLYMALIREWKPDARAAAGWGVVEDTDDAYHDRGKLNDHDWRDHPLAKEKGYGHTDKALAAARKLS